MDASLNWCAHAPSIRLRWGPTPSAPRSGTRSARPALGLTAPARRVGCFSSLRLCFPGALAFIFSSVFVLLCVFAPLRLCVFFFSLVFGLQELDVEAQALQLPDEHVERLREPRCERGIALDDGLVDLGAAVDVGGLRGEELLEGVGGAVGFDRPDLHLS